jgi:hypothetical protein
LKAAAVPLIVLALGACNLQNNPAPSPSPTSAAQSPAADLRTHLDLLLAEQVMIVAKESAAAVDHSDEYSAYTSLLATNSADLTAIVARAFGNTAGVQFAQLWNAQNGYLVDYAIGVVTHNNDRAGSASDNLNLTFVPHFGQFLHDLSGLPLEPVTALATQQAADDKALIDDVFTASFKAYYADLHRAYGQTSLMGDLLADQIVSAFPDKFPGDATTKAVDARVAISLALQEHSYLATMATDATLGGREGERVQALAALTNNNLNLQALVQDQRFALAWAQETTALEAYAGGNGTTSKAALTDTFVGELASITKAPAAIISNHVDAAIKVVDGQRSRATTIAQDDRAAATSMQPIADSVEG